MRVPVFILLYSLFACGTEPQIGVSASTEPEPGSSTPTLNEFEERLSECFTITDTSLHTPWTGTNNTWEPGTLAMLLVTIQNDCTDKAFFRTDLVLTVLDGGAATSGDTMGVYGPGGPGERIVVDFYILAESAEPDPLITLELEARILSCTITDGTWNSCPEDSGSGTATLTLTIGSDLLPAA